VTDTKPAQDRPHGAAAARQGDLTQGPILRTLVLFSLPTMFTNILQTLGQTINTIWVGQLLGEEAIAATANANMVIFLSFAFVFGFSMATTVKVGQNFGARDVDGVRRVFGTGTGFCTAISILGALTGWLYADELLHLLATPASVREPALAYLRVSFLAIPFSTISMMVSMSMRGVGDAKTPLYAMILTTVLTVILNPLLIMGIGPFPELGIAGSALAQASAAAIGAAAMIGWAYIRDLPLRLRGRELAYLLPLREELGYVVGKGMPMGAQMLITSSSGVIMIGLVNREGMLTTAAYGAVMQIWNYVQMPSFAISTAVSAMVAQNVGASQHGRVNRITMAGLALNGLVTISLSTLLLGFDKPLLALFLGIDSGAIPVAERMQLIAIWSWVLTGLMMILSGTLRSYGYVLVPLIIMAVSLYPARLGFYYLTYPTMGVDGLWLSYVFGSAVALALTVLAYKYGSWRKMQATAPPEDGAVAPAV
jgi:putative MATE family efflux protein